MVYTQPYYQPLTPNDYYGWEFQFPRLTTYTTDVLGKYRARGREMDDRRKKAAGITHMYRNELTTEVPPPLPVNHMCDNRKLRAIIAESK